MKRPFAKILLGLLLVGSMIFLVILVSGRLNLRMDRTDSSYIRILQDAYTAVSKNYVDPPDKTKIVKSMVDGMLAALDPHSAYLPPEPFHEMEIQMAGAFGGIGIELGMKEGHLTVIAPIDDTPAFRAGIHANDFISKIDGKSTNGMTIGAAVKIMRGTPGTPVTLTIERADSHKSLIFPLIRDVIKISSIKSRLLESGYGFIRISQFQQRTGEEFKQALQKLKDGSGGDLKGLVIDLRYNPGGLLNASIDVANNFIGETINDSLIVSTKGRLAASNHEYHASLGAKEPSYPIVVLINGGSASASEIVAGALQDHKRAIIMGKQSFGKGSVQSIIPLKGDAALKLTTARYYTPSGRSIQAKGIEPDIFVDTVPPVVLKEIKDDGVKESELENRLNSLNSKVKEIGKANDVPVVKKTDETAPKALNHNINPTVGDVEKDYQLRRAVELLKSLQIVREQLKK